MSTPAVPSAFPLAPARVTRYFPCPCLCASWSAVLSCAAARCLEASLRSASATDSFTFSPQMSRIVNLSMPCLSATWLSGDFQGPRPQIGHI